MITDTLPPPVRDAFYIAVGLPVLAVQELRARETMVAERIGVHLAEVRPRVEELGRLVTDRLPTISFGSVSLSDLNARLDDQAKVLESRIGDLEHRIEEALDRFGGQLPEPAREVLTQARGTARDARSQLRSLVRRAA